MSQDLLDSLLVLNGVKPSENTNLRRNGAEPQLDAATLTILQNFAKTGAKVSVNDLPRLVGADGLYTSANEVMIDKSAPNQAQVLLHEAMHAVDKEVFAKQPKGSPAGKAYAAMRKSFEEDAVDISRLLNRGNVDDRTRELGKYSVQPEERLAFGSSMLFDGGENLNPIMSANALMQFLEISSLLPKIAATSSKGKANGRK